MAILLLLGIVSLVYHLSLDYSDKFRLREFRYWIIAISFSFLAAPMMLYALYPNRLLLGIGAFAAALVPFSFPLQELATRHVSQRVSYGFVMEHAPLFWQLLPTWMPLIGVTVFLVTATLLGWATKRFVDAAGRRLSLGLVTLAGTWFWVQATYQYSDQSRLLDWDPMLGFVGYTDEVEESDKGNRLLRRESMALAELEGMKPAAADSPNVIVFMADTVNVGHLGQFGHERDTMPFLTELEQHYPFVRRYIARSACAESICGVFATLASRHFSSVPPFKTLGIGDVLKKNGYEVHFVLVSDHRHYSYGSYARFMADQTTTLFDYRNSDRRVNDDRLALEGLDALPAAGKRPALIFVFLFSAHAIARTDPRFAKFGPFLEDLYAWYGKRRPGGFPADLRRRLADHYDNRLWQLNYFLREGFGILRDKGYTQNAQLLFLGDHGEDTGDGWWLGHRELTENGLRIPLVWASSRDLDLPSSDSVVPSQLDVAPTILSTLELPVPFVWQGSALDERAPDALHFHEYGLGSQRGGKDCEAVYGSLAGYDEAKLIRCREADREPWRMEFFDVATDYYQYRNLWPSLTPQQRRGLEDILARAHFRGAVESG